MRQAEITELYLCCICGVFVLYFCCICFVFVLHLCCICAVFVYCICIGDSCREIVQLVRQVEITELVYLTIFIRLPSPLPCLHCTILHTYKNTQMHKYKITQILIISSLPSLCICFWLICTAASSYTLQYHTAQNFSAVQCAAIR